MYATRWNVVGSGTWVNDYHPGPNRQKGFDIGLRAFVEGDAHSSKANQSMLCCT